MEIVREEIYPDGARFDSRSRLKSLAKCSLFLSIIREMMRNSNNEPQKEPTTHNFLTLTRYDHDNQSTPPGQNRVHGKNFTHYDKTNSLGTYTLYS